MASKLILMSVSLALILAFGDSQPPPVEPIEDLPTDPSTDPPSTDPPTISDLILIQDNLCANIELAIDTQCLNKTYNQTYTISFTRRANRRCRKLTNQIKRQDATVSITICEDRSNRIQTIMTTDHLRWLCNHRFAETFTVLREPEPGEEDLCTTIQGLCPGNTENLPLCQALNVACMPPGIPGFCFCCI